jgi:hypothetical protein
MRPTSDIAGAGGFIACVRVDGWVRPDGKHEISLSFFYYATYQRIAKKSNQKYWPSCDNINYVDNSTWGWDNQVLNKTTYSYKKT